MSANPEFNNEETMTKVDEILTDEIKLHEDTTLLEGE